MPGKRITDHQVIKYKESRGKLTQEAAAAKLGLTKCFVNNDDADTDDNDGD